MLRYRVPMITGQLLLQIVVALAILLGALAFAVERTS
jgi:hypothetical protein